MNKKFIKVSLVICIPLIVVIGFFLNNVKINHNAFEDESLFDKFTMEYKDYKEDKYSHIITLTAINNTKNIASLYDLELSFNYIGDGLNPGEFYIDGYEEDRYEEFPTMGIDPGDEKDIIFKIPKAININEDEYDIKRPYIGYSVSFYKFRQGKNRLILGIGSLGSGITLGQKN